MLSGGVRCVSDEQVRHRQRRKDAAAQTAWTKGQHTDSGIWEADIVHACQTGKRVNLGPAILSWSIRWNAELVVGSSGCHRAGVGDQNTCGERQDSSWVGNMESDRILGMRAVPWLPDGSDTTFDTQAGMVPRSPGEVLMETKVARTYFR